MGKNVTTGGVRTHADIHPLDLKSNALTTRPPWFTCATFTPTIVNFLMYVSVENIKYLNFGYSHVVGNLRSHKTTQLCTRVVYEQPFAILLYASKEKITSHFKITIQLYFRGLENTN